MEAHTHLKRQFSKQTLVIQGKIISSLHMCLTSRSSVSRLVPLLLGIDILFSTPIQDGSFARFKTSDSDPSWKQMVLTTKRATNLETKLLEVRHMSRLEFFYLGLRNSVLRLAFLNGMCVASPSKTHGFGRSFGLFFTFL